jgi:hypothetical protein
MITIKRGSLGCRLSITSSVRSTSLLGAEVFDFPKALM